MAMDDFITVVNAGTTITTGAASANAAVPNAGDGTPARYVRVSATAACYVRLGKDNTVTASNTGILVQPADAVILMVPVQSSGTPYIAAIQESAAGKCNVVPLEQV